MIHRIFFMGTPHYAARYLEGLIAADLVPIAVITQLDRPAGRKQIIEPTPVKLTALKHDIPIYQPEDIREPRWTKKIRELAPELIIVVAFGQIIPQSILDIPPYGCINVHPSLLPKYRGASPLQESLLHGDTETGVTIMRMDAKMDHGPILAQEKISISPTETIESLREKTITLGATLLIKTVLVLFSKTISEIIQDDSQATYTRLLTRESGKIDWLRSAEYIERQVRALNPWPGTWTMYEGKRLKILKTSLMNTTEGNLSQVGHIIQKNGELIAYCNPGILRLDEIHIEGKKPMMTSEFLRGYSNFFPHI